MSFRPCLVVPVFNHGPGLAALVDRLALPDLSIFVVDDGSDPDTQVVLDDVAARSPSVRLLRHARNRGKGAAVATGLRGAHCAGFSHALQIDADGQHDSRDIPKFLRLAAEHPVAVIAGIPIYDESVPWIRRAARYLTHVWVWIETLSFSIRDSMCGFRVYPLNETVRLVESTNIGRRMDFDTEILVRLNWRGVKILSIPTKVIYPSDGQSRFRLWHDNALITAMHVRLVFGMLVRAPRILYRRIAPSAADAPVADRALQ
jgi:glycosyltransferase involved in cell wall biosynthesis